MKRFPIAVGLCAGLLAVFALLLVAPAQNAHAASAPLSPPSPTSAAGLLAASQPFTQTFTCTVNVTTTTSVIPTNYTLASAAPIATYSGLALVPSPTYPISPTQPALVPALSNWFVLGNATPGIPYTFEADPDSNGNYNLGMEIYSGAPGALTLLASDVNTGDGPSAQITWTFPGLGPYYVRIFQISSVCLGGTYTLKFSYVTPTGMPTITPKPTKTPGPTRTPYAGAPGVDRFEPNNDFDHAATIGLNAKYDNLNFVEWIPTNDSWNNDYFKLRVKPGMLINCKTLDLKPGTDTILTLYDDNRNEIASNDDVNRAAGDLSSSVTYYTTYEGWLYALVDEGFNRPVVDQQNTGYSFECLILNQDTPTPSPTPTINPNLPTFTPTPSETPIPSPTDTPVPVVIVVKPLPTPTPPGLPTSQVPVSLLAYYDANGNNKYDPSEGIVGVPARVIDLTTGNLLAQGMTDETGRVSFTVNAPGAVQLVVPFMNYSTIILPSGGAAVIRVSARELPSAIP